MTPAHRLAPAPLPDFAPSAVVDLDVRDDLRAGREPLARIRAAATSLPTGCVLHVRSPFQPTPLFAVLSGMGFEFHTECYAADDWSSWFWRDTPVSASPPAEPAALRVEGAWDLRGMPPPEPLRLLLERVDGSAAAFDVVLPAWSDMIGGLLAERGWNATVITSTPDGTHVRINPTTHTRSRYPS